MLANVTLENGLNSNKMLNFSQFRSNFQDPRRQISTNVTSILSIQQHETTFKSLKFYFFSKNKKQAKWNESNTDVKCNNAVKSNQIIKFLLLWRSKQEKKIWNKLKKSERNCTEMHIKISIEWKYAFYVGSATAEKSGESRKMNTAESYEI